MQDVEHRINEIITECGGCVSVAVRGISHNANISISADVVHKSASVIKVPILVEAIRRVKEHQIALTDEFVLLDKDRTPGSGILACMHTGIPLTLRDLLTLMIIVSDNTATNMIIDMLGPDSVNETMRSMGFTSSVLRRKMYDMNAFNNGVHNVCTAADMADLLAQIVRNDSEWNKIILEILKQQQDCDRLGMMLPRDVQLSSKSGSITGVVHDCGIVQADDLRYSICVLTTDAKSRGDAILAIARISKEVYNWMARLPQNAGTI